MRAVLVSLGVKTSLSHRTFPVAASKHKACKDGPPLLSGMPVVRKTCPLLTMGDDQPKPGIVCFQATLLVADQSSGRLVDVECPWPVGPRNSVHSFWALAMDV